MKGWDGRGGDHGRWDEADDPTQKVPFKAPRGAGTQRKLWATIPFRNWQHTYLPTYRPWGKIQHIGNILAGNALSSIGLRLCQR